MIWPSRAGEPEQGEQRLPFAAAVPPDFRPSASENGGPLGNKFPAGRRFLLLSRASLAPHRLHRHPIIVSLYAVSDIPRSAMSAFCRIHQCGDCGLCSVYCVPAAKAISERERTGGGAIIGGLTDRAGRSLGAAEARLHLFAVLRRLRPADRWAEFIAPPVFAGDPAFAGDPKRHSTGHSFTQPDRSAFRPKPSPKVQTEKCRSLCKKPAYCDYKDI